MRGFLVRVQVGQQGLVGGSSPPAIVAWRARWELVLSSRESYWCDRRIRLNW